MAEKIKNGRRQTTFDFYNKKNGPIYNIFALNQ